MIKNIEPKLIDNEEELKYILSIKEDDVTLDLLRDLFANRKDSNAKYNPNDFFKLPINTLYNKSSITTTMGRYITNTLILTEKLGPLLNYINKPFNEGTVKKIEGKLADYLLDDIITVEDFSTYIDKIQWLGFSITDFINPPLTTDLLTAPKNVKDKKKELLSDPKLQKELDEGSLVAISELENELLDMSKKELSDLPDMDIYESGSRGSFGNNYKMTAISRGPIKSMADPSKVNISTASLEEGTPSDEQYMYADIMATASYMRSIDTQKGGYEGKKLSASLQSAVLDKENSDCGTDLAISIGINEDNKDLFINRYIKEGNNLILLTNDNISKYINKIVKLRSPMYCKTEKICNKCAGELYYKLGIENLGLVSNALAGVLINLSMKSFHDTSVSMMEIDPFNFID